jgi:hypothetical protein
MKTENRQKEITKTVHDSFINETVYITDDGKEFLNIDNATQHEQHLLSEKNFIEKYKVTPVLNYEAIYISELTEDNKKEIWKHYPHGSYTSDIKPSELKFGWNLIEVDDSGDYTYVYIRNLNYEILNKEEEIKELKKLYDIC